MSSASQETPAPSGQSQSQNQRPASEAIPYKGPPLPNVVEDLIVPNILPTPLPSFSTVDADERVWVPQAPDIDFRPLIFSVSQGYFVNLLRVRRSGILSRHRHTGPVHAVTLKGRWHYLEHAWWANEGGYSYEPSGDIHTLEVPDGVDEMITLFHVTGAYVYVDPDGKALGIEDVFSKLQSAREHYERVGLGADYANQFIR
ncbi:ChrR Cupin-like domain family protein [Pleurostoma richardsiae]|uniref:ChrR Cupin-like domain family protein n=1 Tax=Pleurostoma richardsiae TaxID=41990 RepID=A0AA38RN24_9PEZI|nr:ChrR Cupin-like domain family protein [Pleurostoma richardsiae]